MINESMSSDVLDICRPFFNENGLNAFSYSRLFKDGTRSEVWSDAAAFDHTFYKARYIVGAYTPQYFARRERYSILEKKVEMYPRHIRDRYRNQLVDQREHFDHDHCFTILNQGREFCEYFIFYAPRSNVMAINFYLNNVDRLEAFSDYFLRAAESLIARADQCRIHSGTNSSTVCCDKVMERKRFLAGDAALTSREKDVARLLVTGETAKEIGIALDISPRTVESHVENMKLKMGGSKKSALVKQLFMENK